MFNRLVTISNRIFENSRKFFSPSTAGFIQSPEFFPVNQKLGASAGAAAKEEISRNFQFINTGVRNYQDMTIVVPTLKLEDLINTPELLATQGSLNFESEHGNILLNNTINPNKSTKIRVNDVIDVRLGSNEKNFKLTDVRRFIVQSIQPDDHDGEMKIQMRCWDRLGVDESDDIEEPYDKPK